MKVVSLEELEDKIYSLDWSEAFNEKIFLVEQVYHAIERLNIYETNKKDLKIIKLIDSVKFKEEK